MTHLDEQTLKFLIVSAVLVAIAAAWALQHRSLRRSDAHLEGLARAFDAELVRSGEFNLHFTATIGSRTVEAGYRRRGGGIGSSGAGSQYFSTVVPLAGVSELHSAEIRVKQKRVRELDPRSPELDDHVTVRDFGFPLRAGWMNQRVREALVDFYRLDFPLDPLHIEEGRLIHRTLVPVRRFDAATLRELLTKQAALAAVIERTL